MAAILVVAEHDNAALASATFNTLSAALQIGGDIHVLVAGSGARAVAQAASQIPGVGFTTRAELSAADWNLRVLRDLARLRRLGHPILVGVSRKGFVGRLLELPPVSFASGGACPASGSRANAATPRVGPCTKNGSVGTDTTCVEVTCTTPGAARW